MARLVETVPDDALDHPTPCERYCVGDLLDHVGGFALAFRAAAVKKPLEGGPAGDAANLAGEVAGIMALDELVIHGWDLAKATGEPAGYDGPGLGGARHGAPVPGERRRRSLRPRGPGADGIPLFDRILGIAGRDPGWHPPESVTRARHQEDSR